MSQSKLLLFLNPWVNAIVDKLPLSTLPVFPFYQSVSRLNYKPDTFDCKSICEPISTLTALPNHGMTFDQLCDQRALELKKLPGTIFVMWSGGIDSTTVMTAILRTWKDSELSKLVVLCNTDSIKENPNFFKLIATKGIEIRTSSADIEQHLNYGYVVTGELCDQLFGSDIVGSCVSAFGESAITAPWKDTVPGIFNKFSSTHGAAAFNNYSNIIDECPFPLVTTQDFCWWLNFTQKWQHVKLRTLMSTTWTNPGATFKNLIHFFDTVPFQVWSLHNQDKKIKTTWQSYKYLAKEYIISYTSDISYMSKLKVPSLGNLYFGRECNWAIDENWKFLTKEQSLERLL